MATANKIAGFLSQIPGPEWTAPQLVPVIIWHNAIVRFMVTRGKGILQELLREMTNLVKRLPASTDEGGEIFADHFEHDLAIIKDYAENTGVRQFQ